MIGQGVTTIINGSVRFSIAPLAGPMPPNALNGQEGHLTTAGNGPCQNVAKLSRGRRFAPKHDSATHKIL